MQTLADASRYTTSTQYCTNRIAILLPSFSPSYQWNAVVFLATPATLAKRRKELLGNFDVMIYQAKKQFFKSNPRPRAMRMTGLES